MDYPNSVPSAGLVNGRFVDEDLITGKPGSLIPASWGNGVTQEILGVVRAGGLTPSEASNTQLLGALRGSQLFQTAAPFDVSRSAATSEFVQRALGNYASARGVSAATQLTAADVGCSIGLGGNSSYTVTLPDILSVPNGATIGFHCRSNAAITIACMGNTQISPQGAYLSSIVMNSGESANFCQRERYLDGTRYGQSEICPTVFRPGGQSRLSKAPQWEYRSVGLRYVECRRECRGDVSDLVSEGILFARGHSRRR